MTEYECPRCGYTTKYKSHFANHLNRKIPCNPIYSDLDISLIKDEYGIKDKKLAKSTKLAKLAKKKVKKENNINVKQKIELSSNSNYDKIIEENNELKKEVSNLSQKMDKLVDKIGNNINITNSQVNSNNTFIINSFGNENIGYIDQELLHKLLIPPYPAIIKLNELIHCHEEHPENHNVKITNINGNLLQVYENNAWVHKAKKEVIPAIVDKSYDIIDECYNEKQLKPSHNNRYKKFQQDFEKNEKLKKKLCKETELMMFNKQNTIK